MWWSPWPNAHISFIETPFRKGAFGRTVSEFRDGTTTPANWARAHVPACAACAVVLVIALGGPDLCARDVCAERRGRRSSEQGSQNTAPTDQRAADDTDKDNDGFPDGSYDLLMIGDSVSLRAVDTFDGVFPHSHIDAEKGRQFDAGRATFEGYIQQNLAGKDRGLCSGHQRLGNRRPIDAIMADAGDKRIVVFVNTRSPQPWVGSTNQAIANAATRYKNVRVIDWYGYSANRNDLFDGDGTHLSTTGVTEYLNSDPRCSQEGPARASRGSRQRSAAGKPSSLPPTRFVNALASSRTSWAPTSNLQRKLSSGGASATADALRQLGRSLCRYLRDTPGAANEDLYG